MGDGHGVDQRTSNYGDGSGSSSNVRSSHDDSDLWASRIVSYYPPLMLLYNPNNHSNHQKRIVTVMTIISKR